MIDRWSRLPARRRRLLVEATAELLVARLNLLPLPGLDWQRALGARVDPAPPAPSGDVPSGSVGGRTVDPAPVIDPDPARVDPDPARIDPGPARMDEPARDVGLDRDIGWAVASAAARVPWRSVCLPQAIAAQRMLRRRGIAARAVVGARRSTSTKPIDLHVWVVVDGRTIVGANGHSTFSPVVAYDV